MDTCGVPAHIWNRWTAFWWMLRHHGDPRPALTDLGQRYGEPHRAYHTLEHIAHCLRELDAVRDHLDFAQFMLVESAIWYHDAVYDPRAKDNEEQSAQLAFNTLLGTEAFPLDAGQTLANMIRLSNHRDGFGVAIDVRDPRFPIATFLDIDLAILGQDQATYDAYATAIRREYAHVPDDAFRAGRAAVLEQFLARPRIYATDHFHRKYEAQARANLTREIAKLRAS